MSCPEKDDHLETESTEHTPRANPREHPRFSLNSEEYSGLNAKSGKKEENKEVSSILRNSVKFGLKVVASSINQEISNFKISTEDFRSSHKKKSSNKTVGFSYDCCSIPTTRKSTTDMALDATDGIRSHTKTSLKISRTTKIPMKNDRKLFKDDDFILEEDDDEMNDLDGLNLNGGLNNDLKRMKSCAIDLNPKRSITSILSKLKNIDDSDSD